MECPRCRAVNLEGALICAKCDFPLTPLLTTKRIEASADILKLPATGETRILDRMRLRFVIAEGKSLDVEITEQLTLGRIVPSMDGKPDVDLAPYCGQNNELGVSRFHCNIKRVGMNLVISDVGSTNGTWLNGTRLTDSDPRFLHDGDALFLGRLPLAVYFVVT